MGGEWGGGGRAQVSELQMTLARIFGRHYILSNKFSKIMSCHSKTKFLIIYQNMDILVPFRVLFLNIGIP